MPRQQGNIESEINMTQTSFTTALAIEDEEWDRRDAIDVYHPQFDALLGETPVAFNLRYAFTCAGYLVVSVEETKTHPVLVVRAVRKDVKPIADRKLHFQHVRDLLRGAGFRLRRDELTVSQTGNRLLVAFHWHNSPVDYAAALRQAEEDAAEFERMPL